MATKVVKSSFSASKEDIDKLFACNRIAAMIWNASLEISKSYALANGGKWISKSGLYKALKNLYPLHSQSVQMVADKYLDARDAAHAAILKGYKNKYPWRRKKNFNTQWKDKAFSFDFEKNVLSLSLGIWDGKRQQGICLKLPKNIMAKINEIMSLNKDAISQIELCYDNGLMLCIIYDDGKQSPENIGFPETVGVDLGEIHSIAACATNGNSIIITGRKLRSINRLRNKTLASISKAQAKCTKGSRRWKKLQRKKRYILSKSKHQVAYKTHEITKNFVDWCLENKVGKVFCGNPEGVQRNTSGRKKKNRTKNKKKIRNRKTSQKLSNWNFGKIKDCLKYKLANVGIEFEGISEAYSSQTCPICGQRHKTNSRNYKCSCGYHAHRDVHGAHNILSLGLNGHFDKVCDFEKQKTKYLRLAA
ncbi:RNA-guided endonuclease TnpB family protein [Selenomonas sp. FC4001]|uniref:RNA-guided endonuclease InsQ/TnpB family protein n=1 Tax=Selenomonas sp. FC4001 TaxID=1408313 RepID=UPI000560699C|nr:RNA-guided endonuclease TnpB family protein [Selenomonas sp. FC4001]